ncbi:MAG: hypothetical protein ACI8QZ_001756 [Chlamydiales bacterium]|jgi:hypothetical protein
MPSAGARIPRPLRLNFLPMASDVRTSPSPVPGQRVVFLLVLVGFTCALAWNLSRHHSIARAGWDESTHLQLPAARMLTGLRVGEPMTALDALHDCSQYPFVAPIYLALTQAVFGLNETVARWSVLALWIATLAGLLVLGQHIQRALRGSEPPTSFVPSRGAAYIAFLLPATLAFVSPLGARYGATLFLEVPVACALSWTLVFWFRALARPSTGADIAAGAWVALALFTKFNYGVLLAAGLGLSFLLEALLNRRTAVSRPAFRRLAGLALVPALVCIWWFFLPLPDGPARAAQHRAAFWDYLVAARGTEATPWARRALDWVAGVSPNPVVLFLTFAGVLASLAQARTPLVRTLWCVLLACGPAVWLHPFHLDRLLLPGSVALWAAAGIGWYTVVQRLDPWRDRRRSLVSLAAIALLGISMVSFSTVDAARLLGVFSEEAELRAYQESAVRDLGWTGAIPSAGLQPAEHDQLVDWIEAELGPQESFAWVGLTSELSPASIHLERLARGGDRGRFLRDVERQIDITAVPGMPDPGWDVARLGVFLEAFDVVFVTSPPDLKDRSGARWLEDRYQRPLVDELGYAVEPLGELDIAVPPRAPIHARLYAMRLHP